MLNILLIFISILMAIPSSGIGFEKLKPLICTDELPGIKGQASATSDVSIYKDINVVRKHVKAYLKFDVFDREVAMLMKLRDFDHVPKILAVDFVGMDIYMEYGGEQINANNIPANWQTQVKEIIDGFKNRGIQHNDIKNAEVLVKDNKIMIIDYGWASAYGQPIDSSWPAGLGSDYKSPKGFDDRYSIVKAILTAQKNGREKPTNEEIENIMHEIWP
jgi:hypothetical protein